MLEPFHGERLKKCLVKSAGLFGFNKAFFFQRAFHRFGVAV